MASERAKRPARAKIGVLVNTCVFDPAISYETKKKKKNLTRLHEFAFFQFYSTAKAHSSSGNTLAKACIPSPSHATRVWIN